MTLQTAVTEPGSVQLPVVKWEIYARERALCASGEDAQVRAGYPPRCGMFSKLERKKAIRERIAYLTRDDTILIKERRRKIEERLSLAAYCDMIRECAVIDEETGELTAIDWRKVRESGLGVAVESVSFDAKTGKLVKYERDSALNAVAQLRDMFGLKAPTRAEHSGPGGKPMDNRMTIEFVTPDQEDAAA